ncbi:replication initiator [Auritidibacter ignavus]|uniref:replication initiator n=1 Tax=Auritidibacter ignavus TaxID=678932 RepID=UPI00387E6535
MRSAEAVDGADIIGDALQDRYCVRPYPVKLPSGETVLTRCGSRLRSACPSCARQYAGDWARLIRSGCLPSADVPLDDLLGNKFFLLTLTAPGFGRVHRVPKHSGTSE